ncbi:sensor domain-containing phosphodiesterase [Kineococcus sp. SYSU DK005]|uniref:sensor domain-containing phosphodiesterase n=1 Tax=Kineococcus sp. SYSU DK005 TaxID=3383126 RepID=UPI003D7E0CF2
MPAAPLHAREGERLASLRSYRVLDTAADPSLDAVTAAAARALGAPAALISLVDEDRQWFKSATGLQAVVGYETDQTPREVSFCAHVVASEQVVVVPDATADARFADNVLVTGPEHVRAYVGAPVIGRDGLPLGTLCVLDRQARQFDGAGVQVLSDLAVAVAELLELRRLEVLSGVGSHRVLLDSRRLRAGIDADELLVHYQPVVDLPSRRWSGVEALVRWAHPVRGLLAPAAFVPLAEASGLIVALGRQVLVRACEQVARWRREVPAAAQLRVAVNVSGRQLGDPGVVQVVTDALALSGLPAEALVLELTETALAQVGSAADTAVREVRDLGVALALDDFGTGYANADYLQRFEPDVVKIDRSFVHGLGRSTGADALARSLIDLALRSGCSVTAEGVQRDEQVQVLRRWGVRSAQGELFSTARTAEDLRQGLLLGGA